MRIPITLLSYTLLLASLSPILAVLVNTTIDDTYGDPNTHANFLYSPEWVASNGSTTPCSDCATAFNQSEAFMGTWHELTHSTLINDPTNPQPHSAPTASVVFTGSAVYVYCILGPTSQNDTVGTDIVFFLDGQQVGSFLRGTVTGPDSGWQFNVPVYTNASIPYGIHTITLQSGQNMINSSIIFDYIVYSHEAQNDGDKTAVVALAAVVSVGVTLVLSGIIYFLLKRRSKNHRLDFVPRRNQPFHKARLMSQFFARSQQQQIIITPPARSSSMRHLLSNTLPDPPDSVYPVSEKQNSPGSRTSSSISNDYPHNLSPYQRPFSDTYTSSAASEKSQLSRLYFRNPSDVEGINVPPPIYSSKPDYGQGPLHLHDSSEY